MEVNESSRFRTALFLTSEKSILAQCNMNTGLLTRNFEFQNVTWTSSAESADRIKSVVTENYGHVIPRVAKWLLAQDRTGVGREDCTGDKCSHKKGERSRDLE